MRRKCSVCRQTSNQTIYFYPEFYIRISSADNAQRTTVFFFFWFPLSAKRRVQLRTHTNAEVYFTNLLQLSAPLICRTKSKGKQRATRSHGCLASLIKQKRRTRRGISAIQIDTNYQNKKCSNPAADKWNAQRRWIPSIFGGISQRTTDYRNEFSSLGKKRSWIVREKSTVLMANGQSEVIASCVFGHFEVENVFYESSPQHLSQVKWIQRNSGGRKEITEYRGDSCLSPPTT